MNNRLKLIPYCEIDGVRTFSDSYIREVYARMESEGTTGIVFCDGTIVSSDDFLQTMKYGENELYFLFDRETLMGMCWLNRFESRFARFHFNLFSDAWGANSVVYGKWTVDKLLYRKNGDYCFDMFVGHVPSWNVRAINYVKKLGAKVLGELPHGTPDGGPVTVVFYVRD